MRNLWDQISRVGLLCLLAGAGLLYLSLGDTLTSFKTPKSFEDVMAGDIAVGDHIEGRVPFLLDSFATLQTWSENRSTGSVTPKKNSRYYYVLPLSNGYVGVSVGSSSASEAKKLADQSYGYLAGGEAPKAELVLDARVAQMDGELADLFLREMKNTYGLSAGEIDALGPPLMIEPRSFLAVRIFCAAGAILTVAGAFLLWRRWKWFH